LTNLYLDGELLPINATVIQKHERLLEVLNVIFWGKVIFYKNLQLASSFNTKHKH
jgi:hypothetical protein